jgi:general secretion pathway protein G
MQKQKTMRERPEYRQSAHCAANSANTRTARLTPLTPPTAGFTLIELMIVMAIIGVLAVIAVPSFIGAMKHAREAVLKEDLHVLRAAIDSYTMDKQKGPQSLDDLVQDGYLKSIPEDPMTHSKDTWVTNTSDALYSIDQTDPGIDDVHSGSEETGSDGQAYSTW